MESKKAYLVRYDTSWVGKSTGFVTIMGSDSLDSALKAMKTSRQPAHILHQASNLELYEIDDRLVWLDDHGREHPAPR